MIKLATRIATSIGFYAIVSLASAQGYATGFASVESNLYMYLGHTHGYYAPSSDELVFDQLVSAFGALNTSSKSMIDGDTLLSALSSQSLAALDDNPLGAAVLIGPNKQVKGAALIHFACIPTKNGSFNCNDSAHPVLTIFLTSYKKDDGVINTFIVSKFRTWAMSAVRISLKYSDKPRGSASYLKVQVREVGQQK